MVLSLLKSQLGHLDPLKLVYKATWGLGVYRRVSIRKLVYYIRNTLDDVFCYRNNIKTGSDALDYF